MATKAERDSRDELIYRLHLAGVSYREIARRANLSKTVVHRIVKKQLDTAADIRLDLAGAAETEHLERLGSLLAVNMAKALNGDVRATEICRRLLGDIARVQGLNTSVAERLIPDRDDGDDADEDGELIDLQEMRWVRRKTATAGTGLTS